MNWYFFLRSSIVPQKGATQSSKVVVQDSTGPTVLKNLLSGTVTKEQTTTSPFNEKAEKVKTTISLWSQFWQKMITLKQSYLSKGQEMYLVIYLFYIPTINHR